MTEALAEKKRIWEVDAARGVAILCVIMIHAVYFLNCFSSVTIEWTPFAYFVKQYGGSYFVFLAGVSAYLGSKSVRRGVLVMACGFCLTIATAVLYKTGIEQGLILIQWGVLHLIGFAMIIYPLLKPLSTPLLLVLSLVILAAGYYLTSSVIVSSEYLFIFGLKDPWFRAWDYFPILPQLGWFTLGIVVGRSMYKDKTSLWPEFDTDRAVIKFLMWCGRHSLQIYLVHMPLMYIIAKQI